MHILLINNLKNTHLAKFIFAYLLKMMLNWLNETVLQDKEILSKRANFGSLWYKVRNTRKCSPRNTVYYTRMSPTLLSGYLHYVILTLWINEMLFFSMGTTVRYELRLLLHLYKQIYWILSVQNWELEMSWLENPLAQIWVSPNVWVVSRGGANYLNQRV